ncbi:MAG: FAD-dependent oxidoreductase [Candidatus Pacebacteria bacterium]|nr:FAD-dependent oxidoreductase [Candidatus Paceibacterota bacterium]
MVYDLAIIGGGPSGITAGIYAARQKMKTVLIAKSFGGQMAHKTVDIENYPGFDKISGLDLIEKFENQLKGKNVEILSEELHAIVKENDSFKISFEDGKFINATAVIIAAGAKPRKLDVEGESEFLGRGVSYCTTCDGPLYQGKDIVIAGGGNAGFESAIFMQNYANKVYILEYGPEARADEENQKRANENGKIELIVSADIKKIQGSAFMEKVVYADRVTGEEKEIKAQGVFVQIGYSPASHIVEHLADLNQRKEIIVNHDTMETRTPGLYAAGDITDGFLKQVVVAAADGAKASMSAYKYLQSKNG